MQPLIKKILFFCTLVSINIFLWLYFDLGTLVTFDTIKNNRTLLLATVNSHYWFSVVAYITAYTIDAALFLPATAIMIMLGGFLFGILPTLFYGIIGATLGATSAFLITRYLFGQAMQRRYGPKLAEFNEKLTRQSIRYMLFVRLVPIFPFFLVNTLAGLTLIPLRTFMWTTAVGIIPNLLVYSCIGRQLTTLNSFKDIFTPEIILAFAILTLLSILPLVAHRRK